MDPDQDQTRSRRRFLATALGVGTAGLAGCMDLEDVEKALSDKEVTTSHIDDEYADRKADVRKELLSFQPTPDNVYEPPPNFDSAEQYFEPPYSLRLSIEMDDTIREMIAGLENPAGNSFTRHPPRGRPLLRHFVDIDETEGILSSFQLANTYKVDDAEAVLERIRGSGEMSRTEKIDGGDVTVFEGDLKLENGTNFDREEDVHCFIGVYPEENILFSTRKPSGGEERLGAGQQKTLKQNIKAVNGEIETLDQRVDDYVDSTYFDGNVLYEGIGGIPKSVYNGDNYFDVPENPNVKPIRETVELDELNLEEFNGIMFSGIDVPPFEDNSITVTTADDFRRMEITVDGERISKQEVVDAYNQDVLNDRGYVVTRCVYDEEEDDLRMDMRTMGEWPGDDITQEVQVEFPRGDVRYDSKFYNALKLPNYSVTG